MSIWETVAREIADVTGSPFRVRSVQALGGGCINSASRLVGEDRTYFVKTNQASGLEMFEAEAEGLAELADSGAIRIPRPICSGTAGQYAFLVLENLEMAGSPSPERFGHDLAQMHRTIRERFGWHRDNTIGSTPQPNGWFDDWIGFWRERRLGFQLQLAESNGCGRALIEKGEELKERFPGLFDGYRPAASLLHGDLWGGNWAAARDGAPVIFDPAVYYGDREADLAMTELFGSPGARFYQAYDDAWPVDAGYRLRKTLYNLYHVINHFNLFGGGYRAQAEAMMDRLLAELRP